MSRIVLGAGVLMSALWLLRLDFAEHVSLDVIDLVPTEDRAPELEIVRRLAVDELSRVLLMSLEFPDEVDPGARSAAADSFLESLRSASEVEGAVRVGDPQTRDALGRFLIEHRFELLLPEWLLVRKAEYELSDSNASWEAWLAARVVSDLETFLGTAEVMAFEELLARDPLLLLAGLYEKVEGVAGQALAGGDNDNYLFWAVGSGGSLDPEAQTRLAAALEDSERAAVSIVPGAKLKWTGVSRFAAYNREQIKSEVMRLNLLSVAAVFVVGAVFLRRARKVVHAVPVVLTAFLAAWTVTTLLVPRVHILVLVVGALLCGIAIDYALHVLLHRGRMENDFGLRMRGVARPLLIGAFTSAAGFSFLLMSELPFIRHLGIFVSVGLVAALVATVLWFAQCEGATGEFRGNAAARIRKMRLAFWRTAGAPRASLWVAVVIAVGVVVVGLARVEWRDDIRDLEIASDQLYRTDQGLRSAFGETVGRSTWFSTGQTLAEARSAQAKFASWAENARPHARLESLASVLPTEELFDALPQELAVLAGFADALAGQLESNGFDPAHFQPFFEEFSGLLKTGAGNDYDAVCTSFDRALKGPLSMAMGRGRDHAWVATVVESTDPLGTPPPEVSTVSASQLQSLNNVFRQYRTSASRLALIGVGVVSIVVLLIYGPRRCVSVFMVPAIACVLTLSILGLLGHALNLFHLLAVFLGTCLSFDYAVFAAEARDRGALPPLSIMLSAFTTLASFGVLATSSIPVVAALGVTVSIMVIVAWLIIELFWPVAELAE